MPQLKQLRCCVQWSDTNAPFQEYGTAYGDGVVETFIIVPNKPQSFCIRLTSQGFIYEGLAMIVFIDGNYQCNRSRVNLKRFKKGQASKSAEIDFLLRQKEKPQGDGMYMGREWRFDSHNIVGDPPADFEGGHFDELGTIEVLVLRCRASNPHEADAEDSSSGQDSDIFTDRAEQGVENVPMAKIKPGSTLVIEEPVIEGFGGLGMSRLFDGAGDSPEPYYTDGTHDSKGKWVWQQAAPPSMQDFSAVNGRYHPQMHHFDPSQSAHPLPPGPFRALQSFSSPFPPHSKHVHWDHGPGSTPHPYIGHYNRTYVPPDAQPPLRRPSSSERLRHRSVPNQQASNRNFAAPHESQSMNNGVNGPGSRNTSAKREPTLENEQGNNQAFSTTHEFVDSVTSPKASPTNGSWYEQSQNTAGQSRGPNQIPGGRRPQRHGHPGTRNSGSDALKATPQTSGSVPNIAGCQPSAVYEENQGHWPYPSGNLNLPLAPNPWHHPNSTPSTIAGPMLYPQHNPYWSAVYPAPYGYYWPGLLDGGGFRNHPASSESHPSPKTTPGSTASMNAGNDQPGKWGDSDRHVSNGSGGTNWAVTNSSTMEGQPEKAEDNSNGLEWQNDDTNAYNNSNGPNWGDDNTNAHDNTFQDGQNAQDWNDDQGVGGEGNGNGNAFHSQYQDTKSDWGGNGGNTISPANQETWTTSPATNHADKQDSPSHEMLDPCRSLYGPYGPYYTMRAPRLDEPPPDAEEEPRYDVPKSIAKARGSTKQVQPGPGYRYYKRRLVPEYIDDFQNPYARFVFKYRTKDQFKNEVGIELDVEPTSSQEIQSLQSTDKQTLIEMLIRAKGALGGKVPSPPQSPATPVDSEKSEPVAVNAPNRSYLKYTIPPHRPEPRPPQSSGDSENRPQQTKLKTNSGNSEGSNWENNNADDQWATGTESNQWTNNSGPQRNETVDWNKPDQNGEQTWDGTGDATPTQDGPQEVQASNSPPPPPPPPQIKSGSNKPNTDQETIDDFTTTTYNDSGVAKGGW